LSIEDFFTKFDAPLKRSYNFTMDTKQKFKAFIQASNLAEDDKIKWDVLLESLPEDSLEELFEALEKFPEEMSWFNDILAKKQNAFSLLQNDKEKGQALLEEIVKEEEAKLKELLNK